MPVRSLVHCHLPSAGLGNQLFPLLKAAVFARINDLPLAVTNYRQVRIGPYLRRERSKRNYNNNFKFQQPVWQQAFDKWPLSVRYRTCTLVEEAALRAEPGAGDKRTVYRFSKIPHWSNYFGELRDHRRLAIAALMEMIRPEILARLERLPPPQVGIHIRMGDFRKLSPGENFSKVGTVRTPEEYFVGIIRQIRLSAGEDIPVSIFSDGRRQELGRVFELPRVELVKGNPDIIDMLLLSRSKIIVTSAGSTFGYWAGFLSEAPIIMHPDHIHQPIRVAGEHSRLYEGPLDEAAFAAIKASYSTSL